MVDAKTYRPFAGLPPLAGLATFEQAVRPGLGIEPAVTRLKRFHYVFKRMFELLTARITAEPIYELKTAFSHHAYLCAEHADSLRTRVSEMREPPLGLEEVPHAGLEVLLDEVRSAPTTEELLMGVYEVALPQLAREVADYRAETNPVADAPSVRVLRFAALELEDMIQYGQTCIALLVKPERCAELKSWLEILNQCVESSTGKVAVPDRWHSRVPYRYDPVPKRDDRWTDLWNQGVSPEAFLYDPSMPAKAKSLMMMFKRLREVDVPEMMASILTELKGKPWRFYRDMSRQLWDEARHAMLGEVGFVALGVDWKLARITHNWSHRLNTECTPTERHAVLFFIEQGLMTRTGKRYEWETGQASGVPLMATIQDFDWADEVLHASIGRQWYVPNFENLNKALEYGDQCWSRILSNWQEVKDRGLTTHENWWPKLYQSACEAWGEQPDAKVLAYATSYANTRADLKEVGAGASG